MKYMWSLCMDVHISIKFICFSFFSLPTRCDSWSNSDRSLEQTSFDDVFLDGLQPFTSNTLIQPQHQGNGSQDVPSTRPQPALIWNREINVPSRNHISSSPFLESSLNPIIHVEKKQVSLPSGAKELSIMSNTPPPRPPKPSYLSERRQEDQLLLTGYRSSKKPGYTMVPRRISLSGLDHVGSWKGKGWVLVFRCIIIGKDYPHTLCPHGIIHCSNQPSLLMKQSIQWEHIELSCSSVPPPLFWAWPQGRFLGW